jgi:hypothetical protein
VSTFASSTPLAESSSRSPIYLTFLYLGFASEVGFHLVPLDGTLATVAWLARGLAASVSAPPGPSARMRRVNSANVCIDASIADIGINVGNRVEIELGQINTASDDLAAARRSARLCGHNRRSGRREDAASAVALTNRSGEAKV